MKNEDLEFLAHVYNALLLVNTKGEDTMVMGECLSVLKNFIITKKQEIENQNKKEEE